jgi:hypothetical protein
VDLRSKYQQTVKNYVMSKSVLIIKLCQYGGPASILGAFIRFLVEKVTLG